MLSPDNLESANHLKNVIIAALLDKPSHFWKNLPWRHLVITISTTYWKQDTLCEHEHLIPTVKQGAEDLRIWVCFAATVPEVFAVIESTLNSSVDWIIWESDVRQQLKFHWNRTMPPSTAASPQQKTYSTPFSSFPLNRHGELYVAFCL